MELVLTAFSVVIGTLVIFKVLSKWTEIRYARIKGLPPGTMGWPLLGENASFLKLGHDFISNHQSRYGDVFKTNIFGGPTVVCTDPDTNKYILANEIKGFVPGYPQSIMDLLGKSNFANLFGREHTAMRGVLMSLISGPTMSEQLLPKINVFMQSYLHDWNHRVLDIQEKAIQLVTLMLIKIITGTKKTNSFTKQLEKELHNFVHRIIVFPVNLPGTTFYKALQARRKIVQMLGETINERRASTCRRNDLLDSLIKSEDLNANAIKLSDEQIIDLIILLFYSGYETVSGVMMMAVKYLHDHPKAQQELRRENLEIRNGKPKNYAVNWNDYKSMTFTRAVILETLRMSSVVTGTIRKTTVDTMLKGHVIPKGWRIYVYTKDTSFYPDIYPEPLEFNPWRWLENNLESHQYFMIFGGGGRLCAGKELSMLEISMFLHYLVTKYRWEEIGENKINDFPRVEAPNGIYFRFLEL